MQFPEFCNSSVILFFPLITGLLKRCCSSYIIFSLNYHLILSAPISKLLANDKYNLGSTLLFL